MVDISDLKGDIRNVRKHGLRNLETIARSLGEVGAARSIVIDEDNVILAGNGVVEAANTAGIDKVMIVPADGDTIVAVRRSGLTKDQKQRLSLLDNRAGELAEWDAEVLAQLQAEEFDFDGIFNENELAMVTGNLELPDDPRELWDAMPDLGDRPAAATQLTVYFKTEADVEAFAVLVNQPVTMKTRSIWFPPKAE